jgi:hypothetical protein
MKQPAHTVTLEPMQPDARMTALITVLAREVVNVAETDDQIDAIIDVIKMQLKISLHESPPLQAD